MTMRQRFGQALPVLLLVLVALGLRLLVWDWHRLYQLGGDEREYFEQALTLLRERRYAELNLMRPPMYTAFLAACIYLLRDSVLHELRLVQAIISALTVLPSYALAWQITGKRSVALIAAALVALNYTLAANATELLTETLFVFGLTTVFWLWLRTNDPRPLFGRLPLWVCAVVAGLAVGILTLIRSVGLPLIPLGFVWLLIQPALQKKRGKTPWLTWLRKQVQFGLPILFAASALLVILPWTARNYATYGAPILVDTTGPENLWLDNDPAGREYVKQQLYAMGGDMAGRQELAMQQGIAVISADPARFIGKMWGEAQKLVSLEYFDDMQQRRAIWLPPFEVWLRVLLGDGMWLLLLFAGLAGLWLAPLRGKKPWYFADARWLFVPWVGYVALTGLIFHVEVRYRLPMYPALIPFAAWALWEAANWLRQPRMAWRIGAWAACLLLIVSLQLLHRPYLGESWRLAQKHWFLGAADRALARGEAAEARANAQVALSHDAESVLARVALARADLLEADSEAALQHAQQAVAALPAHPLGHVMLGGILRAQGELDAARAELAYEANTRQDLQAWSRSAFAPLQASPSSLLLGEGLDLGWISDFWLAEQGFRWSRAESRVWLAMPNQAQRVVIVAASGRAAGSGALPLDVMVNGELLATVMLASTPERFELDLVARWPNAEIVLRSPTFVPRDSDPSSGDDRQLGAQIYSLAIE
jgi:hypothetical protein